MIQKLTRRDALRGLAAGTALPLLNSPSLWAADPPAPEKQDLKIAAIGVGGSRGKYRQGTSIARAASRFGTMVACCDVDDFHANEFNGLFEGKLKTYRDYRKLFENEKVDVVTIGTPDHWHTAIAIEAMRNGCDVYCEKPLTLTIDEGKLIRQVVQETGAVFQVGTQQRSSNDNQFLKAVVMAQSGRLGKNLKAYVGIGGGPSGGPFQTAAVPSDLDWNMWLGQAPEVEYTPERAHAEFRWWLEYSGGKMTDWGAHNIDIAMWALGVDQTGPVEVSGKGTFPQYIPASYDPWDFFSGKLKLPNGYNTAVNFEIDFRFDNGTTINVQPNAKGDNGNGILLEGDEGRIFVNRGKLAGKPIEEMSQADQEWLDAEVIKLYGGKQPGNHMGNFFECIADRSRPISDVWSHHRIMTCCHMCNITLLLGRPLQWDPEKEEFIGDEQANRLLTRPQRKGFEIKV